MASSSPGVALLGRGCPEYEAWKASHPCPIEHFDRLTASCSGKAMVIFLDYDGTLTPIVSDPDAAVMSDQARRVVHEVAELFPCAVVSGRGRAKVQSFMRLPQLYYAGSHGMDILGPEPGSGAGPESGEEQLAFQPAVAFQSVMADLFQQLQQAVAMVPGAAVENNTFCLSVHFRNCAREHYDDLLPLVEEVVHRQQGNVRLTRGRKVLEIRPKLDWNKGHALLHLLKAMGLHDRDQVFALYIGDDRTDEDAFQVLKDNGLGHGILVSTCCKPTAACWVVDGPPDVLNFLAKLVQWGLTEDNLWHKMKSCKGWHIAAEPSSRQ